MAAGNVVQVVVGPEADTIASDIEDIIAEGETMTTVLAPGPGGAPRAAAEVPDPVFSAAMVGPGRRSIRRGDPGTAVAPIAGKVVKLHPHALSSWAPMTARACWCIWASTRSS